MIGPFVCIIMNTMFHVLLSRDGFHTRSRHAQTLPHYATTTVSQFFEIFKNL